MVATCEGVNVRFSSKSAEAPSSSAKSWRKIVEERGRERKKGEGGREGGRGREGRIGERERGQEIKELKGRQER